MMQVIEKYGAPWVIRTPERLVITQTVGLKLALIKSFRFKEWRALRDSNSRPSGS